MIALQARSPQLPDPSRRTAQFVNMMNMARQQEAAERQSALAQQAMTIEAAKEARAAALHGPALTKAQQDNIVQALGIFREAVGDIAEGDVAAAEAVRADLVRRVPGFDEFLPPASTWDRNTRNRLMITSEKEIEKTIATPVASLELSQDGMPRSVTVGGLRPGQEGVYDVPETPAAPRTPTAPQPSAMGREPSAVSGAEMTFGPDETRPLNATQQEDLRRIQSETGMTDTPASFTGMGAVQMTPEVMSRIVDSAFQTGVMAQVDFDQLLATQPPQNKQALVDSFRRANITLQADAPSLADSAMGANPVQTPESQFAVYRGQPMQSQTAGLGGAPEMRQTLAQTRTSTPLQVRNPNQPIAPGSSVVPLGRLKAEADVRRETPAQIQARKTAELQATEAFEEANKDARLGRKRQEVFEGERAKKDAAFLDTYSDATIKSRTTLNVIDQMIGDARIEKDRLVVPKGGRRPHPGFEGVVGMGVPGVRLFPGTAAAGFDALFEQAEGGAFLQAYESLRGTGQITEIEGTKATSALTRMKRSQSEAEFVKAAREFADVLRAGVARADKRYTRLTGEAPPPAPTQRKTPTSRLSAETRAKYGL
jgi:hypothetical protein